MRRRDTAQENALRFVRWALEKKALRPVVLDVRRHSNFCDYFVILSGESGVQVRAIYNALIDKASLEHLPVAHTEGGGENRWLLIDCTDVMVHIFLEEERKYYDLEYLWKKAGRVPLAGITARRRISGKTRKRNAK